MKYIFGPVPSRRLGKSLGVDTIPLKTCNWNCVYCQLGRSRPVVHERKDYYPPEDILQEIHETLAKVENGEIDWLTFVGSGEPTLHASIGWLIQKAKGITEIPIAVITNGSFLYDATVRHDLSTADAVLPTLDAGTPELYKKINRPHPEASHKRLVNGLVTFRDEYHGKLWVEVMLIRNLNDSEQALQDLEKVMQQIQPDKIHITLPERPPAETWVEPADEEGIMRAQAILGEAAEVAHPAVGTFTIQTKGSLKESILSIITRHPMRKEDLAGILSDQPLNAIGKALFALESEKQARAVERYGVDFWSASPAYFPDNV